MPLYQVKGNESRLHTYQHFIVQNMHIYKSTNDTTETQPAEITVNIPLKYHLVAFHIISNKATPILFLVLRLADPIFARKKNSYKFLLFLCFLPKLPIYNFPLKDTLPASLPESHLYFS